MRGAEQQKREKIEMNKAKDRETEAERDCRSPLPISDLSAFNQSRHLISVGALKKISQRERLMKLQNHLAVVR